MSIIKIKRGLTTTSIAALTLGVVSVSSVIPAGAVSIVGETVAIDQLFPDLLTVVSNGFGGGNFVVGAGVETNIFGSTDIDVAGNSVTITASRDFVFQSVGTFNGFRINDVFDAFGDFTSFVIDSQTFTGDVSVSFDTDSLFINFINTDLTGFTMAGESLTATFTVADVSAVPLPAALPLFAGGLGLLGLTNWRRRTKVAAT